MVRFPPSSEVSAGWALHIFHGVALGAVEFSVASVNIALGVGLTVLVGTNLAGR